MLATPLKKKKVYLLMYLIVSGFYIWIRWVVILTLSEFHL